MKVFELIKNHPNVTVLAGYIILTIIMTYPLITDISGSVIEKPTSDAFMFIWNMWWIKKSILLKTNPYYTYYIFYPTGGSLVFASLSFFNSLLGIFFQLFVNSVAAYNLLTLFAFVMSAFGMYLLTKYLTHNNAISFISGFVFAFYSQNMSQFSAGHLSALTVEWIPFYILFLIKTFRESSKKNAILAGVFLFLASITYEEHMMFLFIFTGLFLLYNFRSLNKDFLKRFSILVMVFTLSILPFIIPKIQKYFSASFNPRLIEHSIIHSLNIYSIFIPYDNFYIGYTILFLAFLAVLFRKKEIRFWVFSSIIFFILALGPYLHIDGVTSIKLPYLLLYYVPFFKMLSVPWRIEVMLMLSLTVLSAFTLKVIFEKFRLKKSSYHLLILIFFLIFFEYIFFGKYSFLNNNLMSMNVPKIYYELAKDKDNYVIIELPNFLDIFALRYAYHQTIHEKRITNAIPISYISPYSERFMDNIELIIQNNDTENLEKILRHNNIRYIVFNTFSSVNTSSLKIEYTDKCQADCYEDGEYIFSFDPSRYFNILKVLDNADFLERTEMEDGIILYKLKEAI